MSRPVTPDSHAIDTLYRIASAVNKTEDPQELLKLIVDEIRICLNGASAAVALISPDSHNLEIEAYSGLDYDPDNCHLRLGKGIIGWVAMHGKPFISNDVLQEKRYIEVKPSIRSEMAVPLQIAEMGLDANALLTIGVVNIDSTRVNAFNDKDLKLLTLFTNEASRVVNRIWLIRHLKQRAIQLESLIKIGQQLVRKLELKEVLKSITSKACTLIDCCLCAFYLLDDDGQSLQLYSLSSPEAETIDYNEALNLNESSIGVVVRRNKQVAIYDLPMIEEHHFIHLIQQQNLCSLLSTPVAIDDKVIGVLNTYTNTQRRFDNNEKSIFTTLAALGAVAIQNASLYARVFSSEESFRKNERLTTLGLMAAEIAHEIRNPLTVIKLLFDSMNLQFAPGDERNQDATVIRDKISQLEGIVDNVLSLAKDNAKLYKKYPLNDLIEDTLRLVRLKMRQAKIEVHYTPPSINLWVEVNKGHIQQVLLNLIFNSLQAMPEGGNVWISAEATHTGSFPKALITLKDSGTGIPSKMQNRIFESFLTSKLDGTGLGLSISKQILQQHSGDIRLIETGPGGTIFRITLPALLF